MRQNNKYLEKVYEEMDIYRQHLLTGRELTTQQEDTFEKIDVIRGWLRDGFSDVDVIKLAKNDPRLTVQDRRARELLAMSYEVFAELRQLRNRDGIKYMYAEQFRKAGQLIWKRIVEMGGAVDIEEAALSGIQVNWEGGAYSKEIAMLMKEYTRVMKEAALIDGAYDNSKVPDDAKKKPTKIIIKRKTVISNSGINSQGNSDELIEEAHYETGQ